MGKLFFVVSCMVPFGLLRPAVAAGSPGDAVAGTYDILICSGACSFDQQTNVVVKGRIVLFAEKLEKVDLQRFDENRFSHHFGEAINGCFTLETVRKASIYAGGEKIGVTSWSRQGSQFSFSLYHSPDAGYQVSVERTTAGLSGTGASWGAGAAAPKNPSKETVIARRTGDASISNCTFQSAEEHEFRRLLADPARDDVFALERVYRKKLLSNLQVSVVLRDWAMAGWLQQPEEGEAQILRARKAMPEDTLIQWMAVVRSHAYPVAVTQNGVPLGETLQYKELDDSALAQLQRAEPYNAALWLMSLRDVVDRHDETATDAALARLASSTYYDDHAAELLKAQLDLFRSHPLPAEYFAAVTRLDPGWGLNGAFTRDAAPYYQNHYPFADIGINNLFFMRVEAGMHELFVVCVQQPNRSVARKDACVKIGRLLAARSRRVAVRDDGSMLLSQINDFDDEDVARARVHAWIAAKFVEIHPRVHGGRPFVLDEIAFINDWMESGDECEAMQRAVVRAGKPLQPPEDFQLNKALYGNFEKTRAK
jgi:hypothetical protein